MYLRNKTHFLKWIWKLSQAFIVGVALSACQGGSLSATSDSKPLPDSKASLLSFDPMSVVPVINGSATQGVLYIHNNGNANVNNVQFSLANAETNTTNGTNKAKDSKGGTGFKLINPEGCALIPAKGSCALKFITPNLKLADQGNSLVKMNYTTSDGGYSVSQVVSYRYVDISLQKGVNFIGNVEVSGVQSSTQYIVGYLYGGNTEGKLYNDVRLTPSSSTTRVSNGFVNGQQVASGQVIAVEFAVTLQNSKPGYVNVVPSWQGGLKSTATSKLPQGKQSTVGSQLNIALEPLTPKQNEVHYVYGSLPLMNAPSSSPERIYVVNNGNTDATSGLTAVAEGGDSSALNITNNCSSPLAMGDSCYFEVSVTATTSGNSTIVISSAQGEVGQLQATWINPLPVPLIYIQLNQSSGSLPLGSTQADNAIAATITNLGNAPLAELEIEEMIKNDAGWDPNVDFILDSTDCDGITLNPGASCQFNGKLQSTFRVGSGRLYLQAQGRFNNQYYPSENSFFLSAGYFFTVTGAPELAITPNPPATMVVMANDESSTSQTFTVTNTGVASADIDEIGFAGTPPTGAQINPVGTTCAVGTPLASSGTCTVKVTYGPVPATETENETGNIDLYIAYSGAMPDVAQNAQLAIPYSLLGNDAFVGEEVEIVDETSNSSPFLSTIKQANISTQIGGSVASPHAADQNTNTHIIFTYSNMSANYPLESFNVNTNSLPLGISVASETTCPTGNNTGSLGIGQSCILNLELNSQTLARVGDSVVFNFVPPAISWVSPFGSYQQAGNANLNNIEIDYVQPQVSFVLNNNDSSAARMRLDINGANLAAGPATPLEINVSAINSGPVKILDKAANCSGTNSVSCTLDAGNTAGYIDYLMPDYLTPGESMIIPLFFSSNRPDLYLAERYIELYYISPTWQSVGAIDFFNGQVSDATSVANEDKGLGFVLDVDNTPYIATVNASNNLVLGKYNFATQVWDIIDTTGSGFTNIEEVNMLYSTDSDSLVLAAKGVSTSATAMIKRRDSVGNFSDLCSGQILPTPLNNGLQFGAANVANPSKYFIAAHYASDIYVRSCIPGGVWSKVGSESPTVDNVNSSISVAYSVSLAVSDDINPYIAYINDVTNKAEVKKYDSSSNSWVNLGSSNGVTFGRATYLSLAFKDDTPYLAFVENGESTVRSTVSVMKYNGTNWEYVGTPWYSYINKALKFTNLSVSPNGVLYVSFINDGKPNVLVYNETRNSWLPAGNSTLDTLFTGYTAANYTKMAFSNDDIATPYLAFFGGTGKGLSVVKSATLPSTP